MANQAGNDKTVIAIIPARGGSKGVPRKNLQLVAGKPLVAHAVEEARGSPLVDRVVVNSEDAEIRSVAKHFGAEIQDRPREFWHDNTLQEVDRLLIWSVKELERKGSTVDVVVLVYPTSPLRRAEHITKTVSKVLCEEFDSALTLVRDHSYLWRVDSGGTAEPTNYDPGKRGPHQKTDLNQWIENKSVYAMRRDLLIDTGCRLGGRIGMVQMSKLESIDIDYPEDLRLAEILMKERTHELGE
jgi:CMP-N,N'-diacetyllegionaminic acid synthase